ncbi:hypothetical protein OS493_002534 [Desmophyllum pertusum]|uniref:SH2 domain-containing protein n=1 Tax=Desmophyllum pertusum TaxID=174260 RepID=A0A9W9YVV9_9CNID|nr:hypothetical protein OS493_002534 [Desmophyllum pertusum]
MCLYVWDSMFFFKRLSKGRQGMPATKNLQLVHSSRCIKPNNEKISDSIDLKYVKEQLAYTGVLETTRIRREGYALRISFSDFVDRFKLVLYTTNLPNNESSCRQILKKSHLKDWQIGRTKVFLKYWHAEKLSEQLQKAQKAVITIQKDELLQQDNKKKEEILKLKTLNYTALLFPSTPVVEDDDDFPPPPPDALGLPPKKSHRSLEEIEIDDELLTDDMEDEEDVFVGQAHPFKAGFGGVANKAAAVQWFQETQVPKGVVQDESGMFSEWFHGIISRRESERLLSDKPAGCFLIRVSESRFGYTLSYRVQSRCKHYMIDQTRSGKFVIVGMSRVYKSLKEMVNVHKKQPINTEGDILVVPCGQESEVEADYVELITFQGTKNNIRARNARRDDGAPPIPPKSPRSPNQVKTRQDGSLPPPLPSRNYQGTKLPNR